MTETQSMPPVNRKAVVSFILGWLAIPFNLFAGLPALILGLNALREINRDEDDSSGRWMSIIGILLGVLVLVIDVIALGAYAILKARQTSALYACQNNLRQIGAAVATYQTDHEIFPPGTIPNAGAPVDRRLSWLVSLLPYYIDMEANRRKVAPQDTSFFDVYARIDLSEAWNAPANKEATARLLRPFVCPAHPSFEEEPSPGPTYYVGIAGLGANAAELSLADRRCGFFGYDRQITPGDVPRGLSYTMIVSETTWRNGPWGQGGDATVRGLDLNDAPCTGKGRPFGGLHPGVVNILFADGAVLQPPFADSAPPEQFAKWATLQDDAADVPNP